MDEEQKFHFCDSLFVNIYSLKVINSVSQSLGSFKSDVNHQMSFI